MRWERVILSKDSDCDVPPRKDVPFLQIAVNFQQSFAGVEITDLETIAGDAFADFIAFIVTVSFVRCGCLN